MPVVSRETYVCMPVNAETCVTFIFSPRGQSENIEFSLMTISRHFRAQTVQESDTMHISLNTSPLTGRVDKIYAFGNQSLGKGGRKRWCE